MLGIYAKTFMLAAGHPTSASPTTPKVRPVEKKPRRWNPAGHWIDPPEDF
ncbi:hypothetical protein [Pseudooceanicola onchidii]|nr:hypothetical protein [Pseudooceanicola onchidii]